MNAPAPGRNLPRKREGPTGPLAPQVTQVAKAGSVVVSVFAVILGLLLGFAGVTILLENGSFATSESESSSSFLGLFGQSSATGDVPTGPWMGLVFLLVGAGALMFGLRALYTTFEGRSDLG